jgi:hypothetical protein
MPNFFISTYAPLATTRAGREAVRQFGHPPFIDGSIRREPDLEGKYPSISCLCRAEKFAPRLKTGDFVAYMTRKGRYGDVPMAHRRLAAILRVKEVFESHQAAARWFRAHNLELPTNCFVPGYPPLPLSHSHRMFDGSTCAGDRRTQQAWDAIYRERSEAYSTFVVCRKLFRRLWWDAPVVTDKHLIETFGRVPGTQNPGAHEPRLLMKLLQSIGIRVSLPSL